MIIVTGAAGFIGSCLVEQLNREGYNNLILVDDFDRPDKECNLHLKNFSLKVHRDEFNEFLAKMHQQMEFIFHIGARTDTTLFDKEVFDRLNVEYSKNVWDQCVKYEIPLVYASSAATYGAGENGYSDDHSLVSKLKPLNPYGESKQEFDEWVLAQKKTPPFWAGLKFFNVYGPNEYHKGRMASVVFHAYNQILKDGKVKLFRSHKDEYKDGEQLRDFIYVKDVVDFCIYLMRKKPTSPGLVNTGTGTARSFNALATAVFKALNKEVNIEYIDIPEDIRDNYQYFTEAETTKLRSTGYMDEFWTLEDGIRDYVKNYLSQNLCY